MKKTFILLTATMLISAPALADEFGSRFGNTSPYALNNTLDNAKRDMQGIGLEDLNDASGLNQITPASGEEDDDYSDKDPEDEDVEDGEKETEADINEDPAGQHESEEYQENEDADADDDIADIEMPVEEIVSEDENGDSTDNADDAL